MGKERNNNLKKVIEKAVKKLSEKCWQFKNSRLLCKGKEILASGACENPERVQEAEKIKSMILGMVAE